MALTQGQIVNCVVSDRVTRKDFMGYPIEQTLVPFEGRVYSCNVTQEPGGFVVLDIRWVLSNDDIAQLHDAVIDALDCEGHTTVSHNTIDQYEQGKEGVGYNLFEERLIQRRLLRNR